MPAHYITCPIIDIQVYLMHKDFTAQCLYWFWAPPSLKPSSAAISATRETTTTTFPKLPKTSNMSKPFDINSPASGERFMPLITSSTYTAIAPITTNTKSTCATYTRFNTSFSPPDFS